MIQEEPSMPEPATPADAYKAIIDELVTGTRLGGSGSRLARGGQLRGGERRYKPLIDRLSESERDLLVRMLRDERNETIHDVLALLTWWIDCGGVEWSFRGQPMPVDQSGTGLHGDYVGRCNGWEWPAEPAEG